MELGRPFHSKPGPSPLAPSLQTGLSRRSSPPPVPTCPQWVNVKRVREKGNWLSVNGAMNRTQDERRSGSPSVPNGQGGSAWVQLLAGEWLLAALFSAVCSRALQEGLPLAGPESSLLRRLHPYEAGWRAPLSQTTYFLRPDSFGALYCLCSFSLSLSVSISPLFRFLVVFRPLFAFTTLLMEM